MNILCHFVPCSQVLNIDEFAETNRYFEHLAFEQLYSQIFFAWNTLQYGDDNQEMVLVKRAIHPFTTWRSIRLNWETAFIDDVANARDMHSSTPRCFRTSHLHKDANVHNRLASVLNKVLLGSKTALWHNAPQVGENVFAHILKNMRRVYRH